MERPRSSVLVTGSAGLVGQQTIKSLAIRSNFVTALYRAKIPETMENVFPVCNDLTIADGLQNILKNVNCVIHLAWKESFSRESSSTHRTEIMKSISKDNVGAVENLIKAMEKEGTKRLVFLSALGASPESSDVYLRDKYKAELLILNSKIPEKIIIRSSVIWSGRTESDLFVRSILRLLQYPFYPIPAKNSSIAPIHIRDISRILAECANCSINDSVVFLELYGQESLPIGEICRIVGDKLVGKPRFPIRGKLANAFLAFLERDNKNSLNVPKIQSYLAISGSLGEGVAKGNPLISLLDGPFVSFRNHVSES